MIVSTDLVVFGMSTAFVVSAGWLAFYHWSRLRLQAVAEAALAQYGAASAELARVVGDRSYFNELVMLMLQRRWSNTLEVLADCDRADLERAEFRVAVGRNWYQPNKEATPRGDEGTAG